MRKQNRSALLILGASLGFGVTPPAPAASRIEVSAAVRVASAYGVVTSTIRSVQHNKAVGGVPNSFHLQGRALDVVRHKGVTHQAVTAALQSAGLKLIEALDEGDHSHFAFGAGTSDKRPAALLARGLPTSLPSPNPSRIDRKPLLADDHGVLWSDASRIAP